MSFFAGKKTIEYDTNLWNYFTIISRHLWGYLAAHFRLCDCCIHKLARLQSELKIPTSLGNYLSETCACVVSLSWVSHCVCRCYVFASECNVHIPREAVLILFSCQEQQHQNSSHQFFDRFSFMTKLLNILQLCWYNSTWTALCSVGFTREWSINQITEMIGNLVFWMGIFSLYFTIDMFYCLCRQLYPFIWEERGEHSFWLYAELCPQKENTLEKW